MTDTSTATLRWQETCDYQTAFTLAAETIQQIRSDGRDPANPDHLCRWFNDGDEAEWFEQADINADCSGATDREITAITVTRHP